ncbi:hypothetical protein KTN00_02575 [Acinetobacter soli]|uniref:hypothetical protein n=1 Tax=Acinetobacter soli TaxID=487316 RepID=UPI001C449302|nr:hypothetical protein [Acinetobacter soli]MBV6549917.1 hypothetical protein [Acinetobacter soli]
MNAHKFVAEHGVEQAKSILEKASTSATHFTEALGGHYAKEVLFKSDFRWSWHDATAQAWYYDIAEKIRIELAELKQVVESLDTIDRLFGLDQAKHTMVIAKEIGYSSDYEQIKQAIEDYEQVQAYKNGEVIND